MKHINPHALYSKKMEPRQPCEIFGVNMIDWAKTYWWGVGWPKYSRQYRIFWFSTIWCGVLRQGLMMVVCELGNRDRISKERITAHQFVDYWLLLVPSTCQVELATGIFFQSRNCSPGPTRTAKCPKHFQANFLGTHRSLRWLQGFENIQNFADQEVGHFNKTHLVKHSKRITYT